MNVYVGIDPGKSGGWAIVHNGSACCSGHTPVNTTRTKKRTKSKSGKTRYSATTEYDLAGMLKVLQDVKEDYPNADILVTIESQRQRPNDSKQVVFQVGRGLGLWEMAVTAAGYELVKVLPSQWKPNYTEPGADKKASLAICKRLYPKHDLPLAKDEARAEAILIADYTMRKATGEPYPRTPPPKTRKARKSA